MKDSADEGRLFSASADYEREDGGVLEILGSRKELNSIAWTRAGLPKERIADALAVAGLMASERNQRRTVVLLLGPGATETSDLPAAVVRRFLSSVKVPLQVWSLDKRSSRMAADYRPIVDVSTAARFEEAVRRLTQDLDRQRTVWLDGIHLPRESA